MELCQWAGRVFGVQQMQVQGKRKEACCIRKRCRETGNNVCYRRRKKKKKQQKVLFINEELSVYLRFKIYL